MIVILAVFNFMLLMFISTVLSCEGKNSAMLIIEEMNRLYFLPFFPALKICKFLLNLDLTLLKKFHKFMMQSPSDLFKKEK